MAPHLFAKTATLVTPFDVSYLLPLPANEQESKSYQTIKQILPAYLWRNLRQEFAKSFTPSLFDQENELDQTNLIFAFAYRFDPCFKDLSTDVCRPQIRITLQYLNPPKYGFSVVDGAVHVFYEFSQLDEWQKVFNKILKLNQKNVLLVNEKDFGINPHFFASKNKELNRDYLAAFQKIIQEAMASSKLVRVALMSVDFGGVDWFFQSFDIDDNHKPTAKAIPLMEGSTLQKFSTQVDPEHPYEFMEFANSLFPKSEFLAPLSSFLKDSVTYKKINKNQLASLSNLVNELQRPSPHLPGSIDCMSCHATSAVSSNLRNLGKYESGDFVMFGYKGKAAFISQRVINETMKVVSELNGSLRIK
jgi:hypothetical protein